MLVTICLIAAAAAAGAAAKETFVSPFGSDSGTGSSFDDAFKTFSRAVQGLDEGDVVNVFPGVYTGTANTRLSIPPGIKIRARDSNNPVGFRIDFQQNTDTDVWTFARSATATSNSTSVIGLSFFNYRSTSRGLFAYSTPTNAKDLTIEIHKCAFVDNAVVLTLATQSYGNIYWRFIDSSFTQNTIDTNTYQITNNAYYSRTTGGSSSNIYFERVTCSNVKGCVVMQSQSSTTMAADPQYLTVNQSKIEGNKFAFYANSRGNAQINVVNSIFVNNSQAAIIAEARNTISVRLCEFRGNNVALFGDDGKVKATTGFTVRTTLFKDNMFGVLMNGQYELNGLALRFENNTNGGVVTNNGDTSLPITLALYGNEFVSNGVEAEKGGALSLGSGTTANLSNCTMTHNTAKEAGGAIYVNTSATVAITDSRIVNNSAKQSGAGECEDGSTFHVFTSVIGNNQPSSSTCPGLSA